ncbi:MAG: Fe-S cluster assembly transcriptional regulator IscR [Candidatus Thiodiazotropha lotti]|uniref:Fe-S cluster assembly transcriptional regulator IscR n=2 Tax=Candidatus Thiodiazotropha TaxID=1913444 RepID=A0A1E2URE7_9GAMM|nr:Fe-S cluster assembly transcriptional regulator IscR [Candidatus Thiodiazotropha endoloripes]MCG7871673.1 Fe-S cluster assembly transcriptional regulator IscR [Candidatus Thiodiazotropha lotti]MCG7897618.1 Fe-S cluster assembly transcriptional regulator IscR [Candidatus Thiodiazotropha weberae]MCG7903579.1 Fe-S cluster assembly transcriptional regulator IscR [Candidatus Thiodiazotropha weberae]MCG7914384.1 Fe-S cluster assembly transcriptional regulator IscR [Candidatus Thiodiazotropha weber
MKLTTKGRYAVTAMLDLSLHYGEGPITLADIAQRQGISLSYLEQLFSRLRKKSLVASVRGPGGGYSLGRNANEIFVGEVISAVDENIDTTRCNGAHNCQNNERCLTHDLWSDLSNQIYGYLNKISLQDLMDRQAVREVAERQGQPEQEANPGMDVSMTDMSSGPAGA